MENVPYDSTHPIYDLGEIVFVPAKGEFLVRDGKIIPAVEVRLFDADNEYMNWTVWTEREEESD